MTTRRSPRPELPPDYVSEVVEAWRRERPDLAVEPVAVVYRLLRLAARLAPEVEKTFQASGVTTADFYVLANLRRSGAPYRMSQRQLMGVLGLTSGTVSVRIDRLCRLGLVGREPDPDDGRGVRVTLTSKGERLFDSLAPRHLANHARLISALDAGEQTELARLLHILLVEYERVDNPPGESLGLTLAPSHLTRERREAVGLPPTDGLLVEGVRPGGPAEAAGIRPGDVLVGSGRRRLRSFTCMADAIAETREELDLELQRADRRLHVRVALE
jgi:DNA-binding MarR family transcriptional regulator